MVVIEYILRTFKSVVSADVVIHFLNTERREHVKQENFENLSAAIIVLRERSFS